MLLSFVTSNAFIITMTCLLFLVMLTVATFYRYYKEEKEKNKVIEEVKEDESN